MKPWFHAGAGCVVMLLMQAATPTAMAQDTLRARISGRVIDDSTHAPIVNANVFIANSMIGTSSDTSGMFALRNVPEGFCELVVSCVGFTMSVTHLQIAAGVSQELDVRLTPKVLSVGVVEVTGRRSEVWLENLKTFERLMLGSSGEAEECRLLNPEVLEFSAEPGGHFRAHTDRVLTVENMATGYRLHLILGAFDFDGRWLSSEYKVRYEEIQPLDPDVRKKWTKHRAEVFSGSLRHFLVSLVNDEVTSEGFAMYDAESPTKLMGDSPLYEVKRYEVLHQGSGGLWTFSIRKYLVVTFDRRRVPMDGAQQMPEPRRPRDFAAVTPRLRNMRPQLSVLSLPKGAISVDSHGQIMNQLALKVSGDWAKEGIAHGLPIDYRPGTN